MVSGRLWNMYSLVNSVYDDNNDDDLVGADFVLLSIDTVSPLT